MVTIRTLPGRLADLTVLLALGFVYVLALSLGTLLASVRRCVGRIRGRWRSLGARIRGTPDGTH